jgi:mannose-6-phosphate isomerase-like protein (cupin superfamily)
MAFVTPEGETLAKEGDLMTVPPGAVHTFKNASETEDCACYMTATPGENSSDVKLGCSTKTASVLPRSLC